MKDATNQEPTLRIPGNKDDLYKIAEYIYDAYVAMKGDDLEKFLLAANSLTETGLSKAEICRSPSPGQHLDSSSSLTERMMPNNGGE